MAAPVITAHRNAFPSANVEISYSPQKESPDIPLDDPRNDHVAMALARIDGYEPGCSLQVANFDFSSERPAIIKQLLQIRELGCSVQIAFSLNHLSDEDKNRLLDGQVELRQSTPTQTTIHSKMMLYKGRYDGTSGRTFVWGGSHNWNPSLRQNDEVFVAISRLGIYNNYRSYFETIWARSGPGTCGCLPSGLGAMCLALYNECNAGFTPSCDPGCGGCTCE